MDVYCLGVTRPPMLQRPGSSNSDNPAYVAAAGSSQPLKGIKSFSPGYDFGVALSPDGEVWAFGDNHWGQLGQGHTDPLQGAFRIKTDATNLLAGQAMAVAGGNHGLSMDKAGRVRSWGIPWHGELGDGPNAYRRSGDASMYAGVVLSETGLGQLENIATLAAGDGHSMALRKDGTALIWGENTNGTLGQGANGVDLRLPTVVKNATGNGVLSVGNMDRFGNLRRSVF